MFKNLKRDYVIYAICCNETNLKYIGSTSNLTSRLAVHLSTFKCQSSMCRSSLVLEGGNYNCIILEEGLQKQDVKAREAFYLSVFKHQSVNKNMPILVDSKTYHHDYYLKRKCNSRE